MLSKGVAWSDSQPAKRSELSLLDPPSNPSAPQHSGAEAISGWGRGEGLPRTTLSPRALPPMTPLPVRSAEAPGDGSGRGPEDNNDGERDAKTRARVCSLDSWDK